MVCERTRAVLSSFLEDVKRIAFITACIVQGVFIVFYAYSIFNNLDKLVFLIIYLILFVLSVVWFTIWLIKRKQKKRIKKIRKAKEYLKWIANTTMLVVRIVEIVQFDADFLSKVLLILSAIMLLLQVIIEFVKNFIDRYYNDFVYAVEKDFELLKPSRWKSNVLKLIDAPFEKLALKKEGNDKEIPKEEQRSNEYVKRFRVVNAKNKRIKKEQKVIKKQIIQQEEKERVRNEAKELKSHLAIIFGKKNKDKDIEEKAE